MTKKLPKLDGPNTEPADPQLGAALDFIIEMDRLKAVYRQSPLLDGSRRENSAEHSWHMAIMALILSGYADEAVDVARVVELLLVHDVVEIDAGDVFLYDEASAANQAGNEERAAQRLFGMLPAATGARLRAAWDEFEHGATPEARFARALDRFQPLLLNFCSGGGTWKQPQVDYDRVVAKKSVIGKGSTVLWAHARQLLDEAVRRGYLRTSPLTAPLSAAAPAQDTPRLPVAAYRRVASHQAETALRDKLRTIELANGITLPTLVSFDHDCLGALHHHPFRGDATASRVEIASWGDTAIAPSIRRLGAIARQPRHDSADRAAYRTILLDIYRALPLEVEALVGAGDTLVVAPRREGYLLAHDLDWLPQGRHIAPHAKRFKHDGGMVVGHDLVTPAQDYNCCVLVDGAIASGVSLMAMMIELAPRVRRFVVLTVHATGVAINALRHLAAQLERPLELYAGDVSGELNEAYYAVVPESSPPQVVVGDLGDMIAGPVAA
jgi:putative hydrolase of HD superfamily